MLRKQLILRLGLVVMTLVAVAFVGIWLLRGAIDDLGRIDAQRPRITAAHQDLNSCMADLEAALLDRSSAEVMRQAVEEMGRNITSIDEVFVLSGDNTQARATTENLRSLASRLGLDVQRYFESQPAGSDVTRDQTLQTLLEMRREASSVPLLAGDIASAQRLTVIESVHTIAVWLGVAVLVLTAAAGLVLYGAARLVLKPVSALLKVSRELSRDHFDARVPAGQPVEFEELASAYNLLAAKMQQSETRTLETLQQLALTLNHELNNAFAIVEMQLERLKRQSPDDPTLGLRLKEIRETLSRMTVTVKSLTNLKRVVLTEYLPGQKMLDLAKSVADDEANGGNEWTKAEVKITPGKSQTSTRSC